MRVNKELYTRSLEHLSEEERMKRLFSILCVITFLLSLYTVTYASSSYMTSFNSKYGTAGTAIGTCSVCHTTAPSVNSYGNAFKNNAHNYATIGPLDSDGDGFTNIAEINAQTFPGNASSKSAATQSATASNITSTTVSNVTTYSNVPSKPAATQGTTVSKKSTLTGSSTKTSLDVPGTKSAASLSSTGKVFSQGRYGEYCTDPARWIQAGFKVGIWPETVPVNAQAVDNNGRKVAGTFSYEVMATGETGVMDLVNPRNLVFQKSPYVPDGINYDYTVTVNGVSRKKTIFRSPAKCDTCHAIPPGHIMEQSTWGQCRTCHDLGVVVHKHGVEKAGIPDDGCYTCHPTGCLENDVHRTGHNISCAGCHGNLSNVLTGTFKISGQAGKPRCADCHDARHSEPVGGVLFTDSSGHGGMLCSSCHSSPHRIIKPAKLGDGISNNCQNCHSSHIGHSVMGGDCGQCHGSSWDPHLASGVGGLYNDCLKCHSRQSNHAAMQRNCGRCHGSGMNGHPGMESSSAAGEKKGAESGLRKSSKSEGQREGTKVNRRSQKSRGSKRDD
jgi:hypothetical protein